jgi:hypothetical protein
MSAVPAREWPQSHPDLAVLEGFNKPLYSRRELLVLLDNLPEPTLIQLEREGLGPRAVYVGRRAFYRREDILDWVDRLSDESASRRKPGPKPREA